FSADQAATALLRQPIFHDRIERCFLPHANATGGSGMARANGRRFHLCLKGLEVHHALEALIERLGNESQVARVESRSARCKTRPDPVSTPAQLRRRRRKTRNLFQALEQATPPLCVRVQASQLVCTAHSASPFGPQCRLMYFRPSR